MNHCYRLVWNDATQRYVPVPETARGRGKSRAALAPAAVLLGALLMPSAWAQALPTGAQVVSGQARIGQVGNQMTIEQSTPKAIVHWQGFDIGTGGKVQFNQPNANAVALNRVVAGNASRIDGQLGANGQVWLVNPNSVVFGPGSQVNVGALVASTLDISNEDFNAGKQVFTRGAATGGITNQGDITVADGGTLALLAPTVKNEGTLSARLGNVVLAGGDKVTLQAGADGRLQVAVDPATVRTLIENQQLITADGGQVVMTSRAADALSASVVANTGTVQAHTLSQKEGRILLLADMRHGEVVHSGLLDASAPNGGDGGFVETSAAKVTLPQGRRVTTLATGGQTGTWLIDPNDYTVAASGGNITGAQLSSDLDSSNVTIATAGQGSADGKGDIHVNDNVSWSRNTLTLNAERNINVDAFNAALNISVDAFVSVRGSGKLNLNYGGTAGNAGATPAAGSGLNVTGTVTFEQSGTGLLSVNGQGYTVIKSMAELQGIGASAGLGGKYALGDSIDASDFGSDFVPIGSPSNPFRGTFDGLGHNIMELTIDRPGQDHVGLFGHAQNATLRNVRLQGGSVTGKDYVGQLVGWNQAVGDAVASIRNALVGGTITGVNYVGAMVGKNEASGAGLAHLDKVQALATVRGGDYVGGLVGKNEASGGGKASLSRADAEVDVKGNDYVGGLIGHNQAVNGGTAGIDPIIADREDYTLVLTTRGQVHGRNYVGGVVGYNQASGASTAHIDDFASSASVQGLDYVGGLVGKNEASDGGKASIVHADPNANVFAVAYAEGPVTGRNYVGGAVGHNQAGSGGTASIASIQANTEANAKVGADGELFVDFEAYSRANIIASAQVEGTGNYVGGLVGYNQASDGGTASIGHVDAMGSVPSFAYSATHLYVRATGDVKGIDYVGAMVGKNEGQGATARIGTTNIANTTFETTGSVSGRDHVGGFVGYNHASGGGGAFIHSAVAGGTVTGRDYIGGLVGKNEGQGGVASIGGADADEYRSANVFVTSAVNGNDYVGGLVGYNLASDGGSAGIAVANGGAKGYVYTTAAAMGAVSGNDYVGGLVGKNEGKGGAAILAQATASADAIAGANVSANGTVSGNHYVGGLVGYSHASDGGTASIGHASAYRHEDEAGFKMQHIYTTAYATGPVTGADHVGGLVGYNLASGGVASIVNAYALGEVAGRGNQVGGLVGANVANDGGTASISNAFAQGNVAGSESAGGLVGANLANGGIVTLANAYATGAVSGTVNVGGLVGRNAGEAGGTARISRTYATGQTTGSQNVGALVGASSQAIDNSFYARADAASNNGLGQAKTTAELRNGATFAGWDIDDQGGTGRTWRVYDGAAMPLLRSFLRPWTAMVERGDIRDKNFDGAIASGPARYKLAAEGEYGGGEVSGQLRYASRSADPGRYGTDDGSLRVGGLYSEQQGFDIVYTNLAGLSLNIVGKSKPVIPPVVIPDNPKPVVPPVVIPDNPKPVVPPVVIPDNPKPVVPPVVIPDNPKPVVPPVVIPDNPKPVVPPVVIPDNTKPVVPPVVIPDNTKPVVPPVLIPDNTKPVVPPAVVTSVPVQAADLGRQTCDAAGSLRRNGFLATSGPDDMVAASGSPSDPRDDYLHCTHGQILAATTLRPARVKDNAAPAVPWLSQDADFIRLP